MRRLVMLASIAPMVVTACGHSREPLFLTLDPVPPERRSDVPLRTLIGLGVIHVSPDLDRLEFARQLAAGRLAVDDHARWAAPLDELMHRVLLQDLIARTPPGAVLVQPGTRPAGTLLLDVSLLSAIETRDALVVQVAWTLRRAPSGDGHQATVVANQERAITMTLHGSGPVATAEALSAACAAVSDDVALSLRHQ